MREILFRGKIGKGWVYGGYCKDSNGTYIMTNDLSISQHTKVTSVSVGQYTGLQDINGVKIFEGDIVTYKNLLGYDEYDSKPTARDEETITDVVTFKNGAFLPRPQYLYCEDVYYAEKMCDFEVIGNIYDTPELLKKEKRK